MCGRIVLLDLDVPHVLGPLALDRWSDLVVEHDPVRRGRDRNGGQHRRAGRAVLGGAPRRDELGKRPAAELAVEPAVSTGVPARLGHHAEKHELPDKSLVRGGSGWGSSHGAKM